MNDDFYNCDEAGRSIPLYLEGEISGSELVYFEAHLNDCQDCWRKLADELQFNDMLQELPALYRAPAHLRASVEEIVEAHNESAADRRHRPARRLRTYAVKVAILSTAICAALLLWQRGSIDTAASAFTQMAVDTHLRHQRGQLPLEIRSSSSREVMDWFAGKLSFNLKLPNYEANAEQPKLYTLEGARLIGFDNEYTAFVSYKMQGRPLSLIITSATSVQPYGGETIISKDIAFHFEAVKGLKVISWTDNGLTYALVSDLAERGQASCVVCHQQEHQDITRPFQSAAAPK